MPCTVVVGGQYGSEGKGKVVTLEASLVEEPWLIRCGGPNSGHTTNVRGVEKILRQLPAGAGHELSRLFIAAGCAVDEDILIRELDECEVVKERIVVDPRAVLVTQADRDAEIELIDQIGSTGSGTGSAIVKRINRSRDVRLAGSSVRLRSRVELRDVAPLLHDGLDRGCHVFIEGTQGFGLSLLHGPDYPFVTSRDTTAAGFVMEVGLSPRQIDEIILVVRTFPIRVGGTSGPLSDELTWDEIAQLSGAPEPLPEYTSVTKRLRRVGRFDLNLVRRACLYNRPTALAVMGLDRLDISNAGIREVSSLSRVGESFLQEIISATGIYVRWIGTGFKTFDAIKNNDEPPLPSEYGQQSFAR